MLRRVPAPAVLAFYRAPGKMTSPGRFAPRLDGLPDDVAGLAAVGQGLIVHEHLAEFYGVELTDEERDTVNLRRVEDVLECMVAIDDRPLDEPRPEAKRVAGNCRQFTVFMVTLLRSKGIPARARCGFGAYFRKGYFEDHWVAEYWNEDADRWILVDAQIDKAQNAAFPIDFDVLDVPRDRFVIAGDAWAAYRAGEADPDRYGLSMLNEAGAWWIAQNMMRDAAALGNVELLPWDIWGAMPTPEDVIANDLAALFDRLAELTREADDHFDARRELMASDERLRVPPAVFNFQHGVDEPV
jgi:hypothetical protein